MPIHLKSGHVPPPYAPYQFERLIEYWKVISAAQNYPFGRDEYQGIEAVNACQKYLSKPSKILFLGCGDGTEVHRAIEELGHDAWGVTLNPNNVHHAQEILGLESVYYHDCHLTPREWEGQFDAVMGFQLLEHTPAPIILLMEVDRVLKRGGFCYFETPHPVKYTMDDNLHHVTCPIKEQAVGWLLKTGFVDISVEVLTDAPEAARYLGIYGRKP